MRYAFGECELDLSCYELRRCGEVVALGPKVFEVLLYLIRHRERVVSKQELFEALWPGQFVSDAALVRCIAAARRAISDGSGQTMIKTQYGRGYRFMLDVAVHDVAPSSPSDPDSEPAKAAPVSPPVESDNHTPAPSVDERKQVTALSCRLGQMEALSAELPPEAMHNLLHGFFEGAARLVEQYDGTVTQFTSDGFVALFGVPVTYEDHAQRALLVAGALQENSRLPGADEGLPAQTPLTLHIGIHTGEVVGRHIAERPTITYLEVGDTLRLTTQLQQLAPAGAILLSATSAPRVEHAARLDVYAGGGASAGNGTTVAYRVRYIDSRRLGVLRAWQARLSRFVGREPELATLHALLSRVEHGQGQVAGIVGEAGLGKSRLLYEFRRRLEGRPPTYLRGQCLSYGQATPYLPLRDLLRRHCRIADADAPDAITDKLQGWCAAVGLDVDRWLPHLLALVDVDVPSEALSQLSPQARRARTLEALVRLLLASSRQGALIVEIENLHWMDASTEECLTLLVERLAGAPVLLLLSYRPGYALPWTGKSYVSVLPLSPLDAEASRQVAEDASFPVQLLPSVLDEIVTRGDGNPFFLEELGVAVRQQDRRSPPQVPETVQLVLAARLDRLPAAAKRLLQTAAVIGVEVPHLLLHAVAALPEEALDGELSILQGAEVLYEVGAMPAPLYRFKHALTQEATYRSLLGGVRKRLHGRIAEVLMAHFPEWVAREPEQVAHHYSEAGLPELAIHYWQLAGQRAMERSAHVEAIRHLSRGLDTVGCLPAGATRDQHELSLRMLMGPSQMAVLGPSAPETHRTALRIEELCQHSGDVQQRFLAHYGLWAYYVSRPLYREAHEQAERLLRLAEAQQDPGYLLEAHTALGTTAFWSGELDLAWSHLERAASLYDLDQHRSHAWLYGIDPGVIVLDYLGLLHWLAGYPEQALSTMQAADALAAELGHPYSLALARAVAAWLSYLLRDINACHQHSESLQALAEEQSFEALATVSVLWRGATQVALGQVAAGIELLRQSIDRFRAIHYTQGIPFEQGWLAAAYGEAGDPKRGIQLVDEAIAAVQVSGERMYEADLYRIKGELLRRASDECVARTSEACFQKALALARRQQAHSWELRAATSLARLWQQQGKVADARNLLAPLYGWFTEGFDTPDLKEAKDLLDELC